MLFTFDIILGYLMGSVCSAVIVSQLFALPDPRSEGSRNPGATNVLRLAGKKYAVMVLIADILKGVIPVLIAKYLGSSVTAISFTCLAAVLGHMYPVFFGFKGGKGVATALGALLGFHFIIGVMVVATWLLIANFTRYSSLASIVSITLAPLYTVLVLKNTQAIPAFVIMTTIILFKHRKNISRLINGEEPKIKLKKGENDLRGIIEETVVVENAEEMAANEPYDNAEIPDPDLGIKRDKKPEDPEEV